MIFAANLNLKGFSFFYSPCSSYYFHFECCENVWKRASGSMQGVAKKEMLRKCCQTLCFCACIGTYVQVQALIAIRSEIFE